MSTYYVMHNGLPPVGTTHEGPYVLTAKIHPKPAEWEIVAHRGEEAIAYCNRKGEGQAEVFLIPAEEFRDKDTESMRRELEQFFAERWSASSAVDYSSAAFGKFLAASVMANYDIRRKEK